MSATTDTDGGATVSTHDRILDIALELFTEQGYDKTTLRDIAERLGTTKAALYYHFKSKADILLELHLRLHALGSDALDELESYATGLERAAAWPELLDRFITEVANNRGLVALHQRNQSAFEDLHRSERHIAANDDMERRFGRLLASPDIPAATRVRIACSIGAVVGGQLGSGIIDDVPPDQKTALVREAVRDMFR
jgi:AcrR family transcriptional regulator